METNTAGRLSNDVSSTARPVNGLMLDGKSFASGPYVMGVSRGCGVDVVAGGCVAVLVDVFVIILVGVFVIVG